MGGLAPAGAAAVAAAREGLCLARRPDLTACEVRGADALDLCGRLSTQDLSPLADGRAVTTLFLSPEGRVLHRTLLAPDGEGWLALDEAAGPDVEPLPEWIDRYTFAENVAVRARSDRATIILVGPASRALARDSAGLGPGDGAVHRDRDGRTWAASAFGPLPAVLVSGPSGSVEALAASLRAQPGVVAADAAAWRQLRVETGVAAGGAELDGTAFPAEAGLLGDVSFTKGCYTGQEVVARQDTYGKVARRLVGLCFERAPAVGLALGAAARDGRVTSVAPEPVPGLAEAPSAWLALGYVRTRQSEPGTRIAASDGSSATVVALPTPRLG